MKLFVAEGYYDLATPPATVDYSVSHLRLPPELRPNVTVHKYEGGHMMYIYEPSMVQLRKDLVEFYESALAAKPAGAAKGRISSPRVNRGHGEEFRQDLQDRLDKDNRVDAVRGFSDCILLILSILSSFFAFSVPSVTSVVKF